MVAEETLELQQTAQLAHVLKGVLSTIINTRDPMGGLLAKPMMVLPSRKRQKNYYTVIEEPIGQLPKILMYLVLVNFIGFSVFMYIFMRFADFTTIETRLMCGMYVDPAQFHQHVDLVLANTLVRN